MKTAWNNMPDTVCLIRLCNLNPASWEAIRRWHKAAVALHGSHFPSGSVGSIDHTWGGLNVRACRTTCSFQRGTQDLKHALAVLEPNHRDVRIKIHWHHDAPGDDLP